jgi:hypothetical protein
MAIDRCEALGLHVRASRRAALREARALLSAQARRFLRARSPLLSL